MSEYFNKFIANIKARFKNLFKLHGNPHDIAMGFAIGTFWSFLPTPGLSIVLAMGTLFLFPKSNKISLAISLALWNPVIMLPLYLLGGKIGVAIFGEIEKQSFDYQLFDKAIHYIRSYTVGSGIIAACGSIVSYFLVKQTSRSFQYTRKKLKGKLKSRRKRKNKRTQEARANL